MINYVDTPPFLRIVLQVAMATMHFHIAKPVSLWGIFSHSGGPRKQYGTDSNFSLGAR